MTAMGRHSPPLDGTVTANGRTLAPFTLPAAMVPRGPVSALPQPAPPPAPRRAIDGDTAIRVLAAAVVLAVAAFAAIVSYSHIFELGRHHGQDGAAARLLPLSVDGLIASASLFMLYAARTGVALRRLSWPRVMLWLGIGATVAANVLYGAPFGWLAAVVSAWPAVAFVGSVEMAVRFVRDARQDDTAIDQPGVAPQDDSVRDRPQRRPVPRGVTGQAKAAAILARQPGLKNEDVARRAGVTVRTVQRARNGGRA